MMFSMKLLAAVLTLGVITHASQRKTPSDAELLEQFTEDFKAFLSNKKLDSLETVVEYIRKIWDKKKNPNRVYKTAHLRDFVKHNHSKAYETGKISKYNEEFVKIKAIPHLAGLKKSQEGAIDRLAAEEAQDEERETAVFNRHLRKLRKENPSNGIKWIDGRVLHKLRKDIDEGKLGPAAASPSAGSDSYDSRQTSGEAKKGFLEMPQLDERISATNKRQEARSVRKASKWKPNHGFAPPNGLNLKKLNHRGGLKGGSFRKFSARDIKHGLSTNQKKQTPIDASRWAIRPTSKKIKQGNK